MTLVGVPSANVQWNPSRHKKCSNCANFQTLAQNPSVPPSLNMTQPPTWRLPAAQIRSYTPTLRTLYVYVLLLLILARNWWADILRQHSPHYAQHSTVKIRGHTCNAVKVTAGISWQKLKKTALTTDFQSHPTSIFIPTYSFPKEGNINVLSIFM